MFHLKLTCCNVHFCKTTAKFKPNVPLSCTSPSLECCSQHGFGFHASGTPAVSVATLLYRFFSCVWIYDTPGVVMTCADVRVDRQLALLDLRL